MRWATVCIIALASMVAFVVIADHGIIAMFGKVSSATTPINVTDDAATRLRGNATAANESRTVPFGGNILAHVANGTGTSLEGTSLELVHITKTGGSSQMMFGNVSSATTDDAATRLRGNATAVNESRTVPPGGNILAHVANGTGTSLKGTRLELVHITKTGGSALEHAAALANVRWGCCHYLSTIEELECPKPPDIKPSPKFPGFARGYSNPWHVPLRYHVPYPFPPGTHTFAVVRNPYDRAISEYYCKWSGYKGADRTDPAALNRWVQQLTQRTSGISFYPQHNYVFHEGKREVDHVLHFESIASEFRDLMDQYGLNITLPDKRKHPTNVHTGNALNRTHLTTKTIRMINDYAKEDFVLFGYHMVSDADKME